MATSNEMERKLMEMPPNEGARAYAREESDAMAEKNATSVTESHQRGERSRIDINTLMQIVPVPPSDALPN